MDEEEINYSPLCQDIVTDEGMAKVFIYEHENGGWILEVEDENHSSYLWNNTFPTDQEALNEVKSVLENEGMKALFGSP